MYCTQYALTARCLENKSQYKELVEELEKRDLVRYAFDDGIYSDRHNYKEAKFYPYEAVGWGDHAKDMVMLSEKFSNVYFELSGDGEDFGDFWKEYYHDGECEFCRGEIVYEQPRKVQWDKLLSSF